MTTAGSSAAIAGDMATPVHHHKLLVIDPTAPPAVKDLSTRAPDEPIVRSVTLKELAALAPTG